MEVQVHYSKCSIYRTLVSVLNSTAGQKFSSIFRLKISAVTWTIFFDLYDENGIVAFMVHGYMNEDS